MRKQRGVDITNIPLPRRTQSKLIQSVGKTNGKHGSTLLLHQKLLPPGPPRSTSGLNGGGLRTSQFCISSSSMGVRRVPPRVFFLGKGRFGKRPPTYTAEYTAPAVDSEDSGFGCDFHSSESQFSWSNDEAAKLGANTNSTSAIPQPIFSLSSRSLSTSSNLSSSSLVSPSSTTSPSSVSSFTIPQFTTSSPAEKQFLTSLLHESLAQEDHAIDHYDGPYYTTTSTGSPSTVSTQSVKSSPFSSISSPASTLPPSSPEETEFKVLLPPPPPPPDQPDSSNQPLDFTQVFGKLQPGFQNPSDILSRALVNELLSNGCADKQRTQLVDEKLIKIDQGIHTNTKLPEEIQADFTSQSSSAFDTHFSTVISNSCDALPSSSPAISVAPVVSHVDPMVILSQAVSLQKELFEEPALDGIPLSVKNTTLNGFSFSKDVTTTAAATATQKGLVVDSHLQNTATLCSVLPAQTVLEQQPMKLLPLESVRMPPDSERVGVSATLPFSSHQATTQLNCTQPMNTGIPTTASTTMQSPPLKRPRFNFPHPAPSKGSGLKLRNQNHNQNYMPQRSVGKRLPPGTTPTLTSNLASYTRDGRIQMQIVAQPEEQHRARYQTEGSRGAIKDRKGNGFPTVKLVGYDKPATLQIFIGTDQGKVSPHMFYQACKVTGKSSTPCIEKKVEGTILIEIEFEPSKEMVISCDCVGILKERNVDVEQRFPFHHAAQSRKKSTKCRMIFRTTVLNSDGVEETLQVASVPILCTQPPGVPEICKQSLHECPAKGGLELFVIGKNFLKDTRVIFQEEDNEGRILWEASSEPLKDYLQQNHLICVVPPFKEEKTVEPVECKVSVVSGGKHSEPHRFIYLPELATAHLGLPQSITSCLPNTTQSPPQLVQVHAPPTTIQNAMVPQLTGGQGLMPVDMQTVNVNGMIPPRENGQSGMVSSPSDACSAVSLASPEGSMCSSMSQPSPQSVVQPITPVTLNPMTNMGFSAASLMQAPVSNAENPTVVATFPTVLPDNKPAVEQLMEAIAKPVVTSSFTQMTLPEKPAVSNSIPLDLQFPTADLPTTEAPTITTVANPFQATNQPMNCATLPQIINGIGLSTTVPTTVTSPITTGVTVAEIQNPTTSPNDVITTVSQPVSVQSLAAVADCLGQAIIKTEPGTTLGTDLRLISHNSVVAAAPPTTTLTNGVTPQVINLMGGGELTPHQGTLASALSQMSDNELINYINPNCFDGALL